MATPMDALYFREQFGRQLRRLERGGSQAYQVAPLTNDMRPDEIAAMIDQVRRSLIRCIDYGDVHYVSAEMTDVIQGIIREHLDGERVFHIDQGDIPSLTGFVYFDGPIPIPTIYSPTGYQNLRAVLWDQYAVAPNENGEPRAYHGILERAEERPVVIGKILYTVCDTPNQEQRERYGPWKTRHWIPAPWGQRFDPWTARDSLAHDQDDSHFRDDELSEEEAEKDRADTVAAFDTLFKVITCWTRIIQEEIPIRHPRSKDYDKVMHKEGRPPADVQVTHLRRYAHSKDSHGMAIVDWAYRWEVKGHYRWQRVGPGRQFVRQVWVSKHVRGPADKPLVRRDSVTSLDR